MLPQKIKKRQGTTDFTVVPFRQPSEHRHGEIFPAPHQLPPKIADNFSIKIVLIRSQNYPCFFYIVCYNVNERGKLCKKHIAASGSEPQEQVRKDSYQKAYRRSIPCKKQKRKN
jgi:hypothetical protein